MATNATLKLVTQAELGSKGLTIAVDGETEGSLMIGKASLVWFKKNAKKQGYKVSWSEFEAWVTDRQQVKATRP